MNKKCIYGPWKTEVQNHRYPETKKKKKSFKFHCIPVSTVEIILCLYHAVKGVNCFTIVMGVLCFSVT